LFLLFFQTALWGNILEDLKGILLTAEYTGPSDTSTKKIEGIQIEGQLQIPGKEQELIQELELFLGKSLSEEGLLKIKETISRFYSKNHHPIVIVITPPQDVSTGRLRLVVVEGRVGEIKIEGNRWTSDDYLLRNLNLKTGDRIDSSIFKNNMAWINRDHFRQANVIFKPGKYRGTTDLEMKVQDRFPLQPYVGADNTGTTYTERTRLYTGVNAGSITPWNHKLSYQFTTAPNGRSFLAHTGSYAIPFSWKHILFAFGGWSRGRGNLHKHFENHAVAWQVSGRYQIPMHPLFGTFLQEVAVGYDFKSTNNSLLFGGVAVSRKTADTNQFLLQYTADFSGPKSKTSLLIELYASPWKITKDQNAFNYSTIRPHAKIRYVYGQLRLSETYTFSSDWMIKAVIAGQGTGTNLLPNEMFGLGGYTTVRGYSERAVNSDDAVFASLEVTAPALSLWKKKKDYLRFLAFFDYGLGILHRPTHFERSTYWLAGTGVGLRYAIQTNLFVRADMGFPLHKTGLGLHAPQAHIGATLSY
jgi:hemolysin activation/secretion protein